MKKLIGVIGIICIVIFLSSCGTTYRGTSGGNGCGVWFPKKFERDRSYQRNWNWVNNPRSGRYRSGVH